MPYKYKWINKAYHHTIVRNQLIKMLADSCHIKFIFASFSGMKIPAIFLAVLLASAASLATQSQPTEIKYSPAELRQDLNFLKHLINNVHVNPNSELTPRQYDALFGQIDASLNDSLNASDFLKKIKPLVAYLSDEHAQINLKPALLSAAYRTGMVYLPFTLKKNNGNYFVEACVDSRWNNIIGQSVNSINGIPVDELLQNCALATTGFPRQRAATALRQFGYLYPWASPALAERFTLKTEDGKSIDIQGTTLQMWDDYLAGQANITKCEDRLSYTRFSNAGYINACSFDVKAKGQYSMDSIKRKIDRIFLQIKQDGVKKLVIDISHNEGGNSAVGDYLISYISDKPYTDYQTDWKRSDEYLKLLKSWGFNDSVYTAQPAGKVLHFASSRVSPEPVPYPFKGKTLIIIGPATFSSAITFATLIRDNHIAVLIGQTPVNGHPNGFGEMYYTNLPHTQIFVRFGVKEYIRPAGKKGNNELAPDMPLTDAQMSNIKMVVGQGKLF